MKVDDISIVAMIVAVTQIAKKYIPERFVPLFPVIVGVIAGVVYTEGGAETKVLYGVAYGLSAMGLFDTKKIKSIFTK